MIKYFFSSLDLDWQIPQQNESLSCSKELADKIINKISKCNYCVIISKKLSNYKGWHIEFYCTRNCDLCRLQFDDIRRYEEDLNRLDVFKNLIFDIKHGY
jgi:hypothetical protein